MNRNPADAIQPETVEAIRTQLKSLLEMQPQRKLTRRNTVEALSPEIDALLERGFAMMEVADRFKQAGVPLSAGTLRAYRSRSRSKRKKAGTHKATKSKDSTASAQAGNDRGMPEHTNHNATATQQRNGVADAVAQLQAKKDAIRALPKRGSFVIVEDTPDI
ncbi:MAG: hypothetical protein P4L10_01380 [Acidobacteriaceae bacterium]|nr:hypothetical protein [Acidobacteriaceae bacterium]